MIGDLEKKITAIIPEIKELRHKIHANPEIGFQEVETQRLVTDFLSGLNNMSVKSPVAKTGVVGLLQGGSDGKVLGLRAEMDALPMEEKTGLVYSSKQMGYMHACGHDGHVANLLATARILSENSHLLHGSIKFIFQPGEEGFGGGKLMVEEGVLDDPPVDGIIALHGWPDLDVGKIGIKYGAHLASTDDFRLEVIGKGTHGANPHLGIDPVVIAARIVDALQVINSRMKNPVTPLVITVGKIHGGTAVNVIPDCVVLEGTVRTLSSEMRANVPKQIEQVARSTAEAFGGKINLTIKEGYPVTINDDKMVDFIVDVARKNLGDENVLIIDQPVMGGEDFSYYLEKIPGAMFRLGLGASCESLHSSAFDFNDEALKTGILMLARLAEEFLKDEG